MLAHHYRNAVELSRAAGQPPDPALVEQARTSLREAGDRAFSLNAFGSAAGFYGSALELAAAGSLDRAHLLFKLGRSRAIGGDFDPDVLAAACRELVAAGDPETAAEAEAELADLHWFRGDSDQSTVHLQRAHDLVKGRQPSRAKAFVLSNMAFARFLSGAGGEAERIGREALAMAESLGLDELRARALHILGNTRVRNGDLGGLEDFETSIAIATEVNAPAERCRAQGDMAGALSERGQIERGFAVFQDADAAAVRFGLVGRLRWFRGQRPVYEYDLGSWDEALAGVDEFLAEVEAGSPHYLAGGCHEIRAQIRLGRDDVAGALADAQHAIELARLTKDSQAVYPSLVTSAHVFRESGDAARASVHAEAALVELQTGAAADLPDSLHVLAWTLPPSGEGMR